MNQALKHKKEKYKDTGFKEDVIPIVVSPLMEMHRESVDSMKKYVNIQTMFKMLAYRMSNQLVQRTTFYNTRMEGEDLKYAESRKSQPDSHRYAQNDIKISIEE